MENISNPSGEHERRPLWIDLLEIESAIDEALKRIDVSGSDFMAREELLNQLRTKYNWYEKWASSTEEERIKWATQYQKNQPINASKKNPLLELAEKNYQTAINFYAQENLGGLNSVLNQVENDTIESSAKELEEIGNLIGIVDIKQIARNFLKYISEFRKRVLYRDLTEGERSYFEQYEEIIESNIDDRDTHQSLLPSYIGKLAEIIRSKKK
jgi:hypothetical protein